MEKFNLEAARTAINTLREVRNILNTSYDLLLTLGVKKRNLRCFVTADQVCSATIMELFLQINRHSGQKFLDEYKVYLAKLLKDENN